MVTQDTAMPRHKPKTGRSQHDSHSSRRGADKAVTGSSSNEETTVKEKENPLAWKLISSSQMSDLEPLTVDLAQKALAEILQLKQYEHSMKEGILLDYYVSGFLWAKEQTFTILQISAFMTLLNVILENINDKHLPLLDNLKELSKLMTEVSQSSSDITRGVEFFTVDQSKAIINYMKISLRLKLSSQQIRSLHHWRRVYFGISIHPTFYSSQQRKQNLRLCKRLKKRWKLKTPQLRMLWHVITWMMSHQC
ncbi:ciliary-associated calcium-binding coiled-coil protein 1 isoform X2 [Leucoraja erinacea]|uniref:ciliary-associated calcium-binding coiled-coil protein 1 isoform X2 n=1 Tax=Leucoraja erinaceus TaxID=7782 RepID=UPI002458FF2A|nr:ciliary-associated calcium-binding coiled-coil protein 1 isoform X2 [Leucoraja erinacea]